MKLVNLFSFCGSCEQSEKEKIVHQLLYKYQIYISGELDSTEINSNRLKEWFYENYILTTYCSFNTTEINNERNLVRMMGADVFISIYTHDKIVDTANEIETARILKMTIVIIYNTLQEKQNDKREFRNNEIRIVFETLKKFEISIFNKFEHTLGKSRRTHNFTIAYDLFSLNSRRDFTVDVLNTKFKSIKYVYFLKINKELIFIGEVDNKIYSV